MAKLQLSIGKKTWSIETEMQQSLLDGALSRGVPVSYSCKRGDCGQCVATVTFGEAEPVDPSRPFLRDDQIYLCNARARSDIAIEVPYVAELDGIQVLRSACKIQELTPLSEDVVQVSFRLPPGTAFDFVPGQYIRLTNKHRATRSYSLACAANADKLLRIQVRRVAGGVFSNYLFATARAGDLLHLEGPMGQFILRDHPAVKRTLFLATGTGIAPVHAILSSMSQEQRARCGDIYVYWGNYRPADAYLAGVMAELAQRVKMHYFEVFSRGAEVGTTVGARHLQELMPIHHSDLTEAQVFAAGNPRMIDDGRQQATKLGLAPRRYFADAFTAS